MSESWDTVTAYGNVDMTLHPVLRRAYRVACLIERCGASPELTAASSAAFDLCGEIAAAIESLQARVAAAEDALASDPVLTDKDLCAAVIVCVMSGEQARRDEACLKLQRHISAVERERDCLETECEHLSDRAHMAEHELSARRSENDALRSRAEAAEKAIKEHNDGCVAACEARQRGDYGQDCSAWISRKRRCLDCARDSMIDYPAAIAAGGDDAKD